MMMSSDLTRGGPAARGLAACRFVYNTARPSLNLEKLMYRTFPKFAVFAFAFVCLTTIGCSEDPPAAPTPQPSGGTQALKANAPTPSSPVNGETLNTQRPTLQVQPAIASTSIAAGQNFSYDFEVQTSGGSSLRTQNVGNTVWTYPDDLALDTPYRWRARAVLDGVAGPWSDFQSFRTLSLPGCRNGRLEDPKAYFFHVIGRKEGDPARHDWEDVMRRSGIPAGPVAGQIFPSNAPHYGLSQQISSSGELRGRLFLPTSSPNGHNYYIQDVDFLSDASGTRWAWRPFGAPAYAPRACP